MRKPKKYAYETSYWFGIIWQKSSIKKNVHWKDHIKNQYFQFEVWTWNVLINMLEGIVLLDF